MSALTNLFEDLEKAFAVAKTEMEEFESGKKKSAKVLRKTAQDIKKISQEIRIATSEQLKAMPTKKREVK